MKGRRLFLTSCVLGLLLGAAVPLFAQGLEAPLGKWWKRPRIVALLNLIPEQQDRLEEIFSRNRRAFVDLKADVERRQIDVEELVSKKDADEKKTVAAIDALEQARMRLRRQFTLMLLQQKEVLTAAQWQTIVDRREEWRRERMEERRQRLGLGPGSPPDSGPQQAPQRQNPNR